MALSAGTRLGSYEIVSALGSGGMGDVYRAYDTKLQRTVAIKVLASGDDETSRSRLLEEARAASSLNHPNICTVHEIHDAGDRAFIVMENVDGRPLGDLIPNEGLPVETFVRYAVQIADAMAYAHEHGVVHRDLKTSNVVVSRDGRAKVLDFGLARRELTSSAEDATRSRTPLAESGAIAGTLGYMAPEVLKGQPADALSDIWALGVLLHRMLSGVMPFKGDTGFDLTATILRDPPSPLPTRVPASLRSIITRCLAKEPAHRYPRADEIRAALETIGADLPANHAPMSIARPRTALPPDTLKPVSPTPSRRMAVTLRGIALATVGAGLLAIFGWGSFGSVADYVDGQGILILSRGLRQLRAGSDGTLNHWNIKINDVVKDGQIVGEILLTGAAREPIRSTVEGRVYDLKKQAGDLVRNGENLATIEPPGVELEPIVYIDANNRKRINPGMEAQISPTTVRREVYGFMMGTVDTVGTYPVTPERVTAVTGSQQLMIEILSQGVKVEVQVKLRRNDATPTGYAWSSTAGPPFKIEGGTRVSMGVVVSRTSPFKYYVTPFFKNLIAGRQG